MIARNSSFTYKGKAVHLKQVAAELGVRYVLEGSVRRNGDRVRITAQLNDTATGSHLWAEHFDRDLTDVFAVQDEITDAIVAAIEPQIYAAENFRSRRKPPNSMDAWDLVMRALSHHWRVTRPDSIAAQDLLERAIAIDPNYGQALALFATNHMFGVHLGWEDHCDRSVRRRAGCVGGHRRRQRGCVGAHCPRQRVLLHAPSRSFACRVRTGAAAQSELLAGAGILCPGAILLRAVAGRLCGDATCHPPEPPRSLLRDLLRRRRLRPVRRQELSGGNCACARGDPPARRSQRRLPGTDGRRRDDRPDRGRPDGAPELRRTQPNISWPGSRPSCPGSSTPIASIIWKAFAAPGWNRNSPSGPGVV